MINGHLNQQHQRRQQCHYDFLNPHSESRNQRSGLERSFKKFRVRNLQKILFPSNFVYFSLFSNRFQQIWKKEDWASDQIELHEAMKSQSCHFSVLVWWKVQSGLLRFYRQLPLWTNFRRWRIWEQTKSHLCSVSKHWFHLHPPPHPHLHPGKQQIIRSLSF